MRHILGILSVALLLVTGCAAGTPTGPQIHIENAWVSPVLAGSPSNMMGDIPGAGYLTIVNDGDTADVLLEVSSDATMMIHLHETQVTNDIARMDMLSQIEIPAHSRIEFKPGARHLMLMGVMYDLRPGMVVTLRLNFAKSGTLVVTVPVQASPLS